MNETPIRGEACEAALRSLDSYNSHGEPTQTDREMLRHMEQCPDCAREFALRTRVSDRLKEAVRNEPINPYLEAKIRRRIAGQGRRSWMWPSRVASVAVALLVFLGAAIAYQLGHLRLTTASQDAYIASISGKVAAILRVGLGDHVHCTVFRKFPKEPPAREKMLADLGPENSPLLPVVQARIPKDYRVIMAHRCSYRGRKFVHLAMRDDSSLISLVIARRGDGEAFGRDKLGPVLAESGIPIYQGHVQRFAIAGFESQDHLVYLVSDLTEQQNLAMLASLAAPVRSFLSRLES
jgi:hypothetical protein